MASLPVEMVTEILSRLPAKSLGRFKCVCKLWCAVIEDRKFAMLHMERSHRIVSLWKENSNVNNGDEQTLLMHGKNGLLLEKLVSTGKYRIRNPTTKYTLALPDTKGQCYNMRMFYFPKTHDYYKLVCLYGEGSKRNEGCQVLIIGTDVEWRDIGSFNGGEGGRLYAVAQADVYYIICNSGIVCLEVETEHFVYPKTPQALLTSLKVVKPFCWGEKLALANLAEGEGELHVWVLEDYKKEIWSERKIVIPLTLFSNYPHTLKTLSPFEFNNNDGWLWFRRIDGSRVAYNIDSKQENIRSAPPGKSSFLCCLVPTLVNLEPDRTTFTL